MRRIWFYLLVIGSLSPVSAIAEDAPSTPAAPDKPVAAWVSELKTGDLAARREAVYALHKLGPAAKAAAPALAQAFEDEDEYVRDTAYSAVIALKEDARSALPTLRSALNDGRERVRQLALWALLRIDPATAFRDADIEVRKAAIAAVIHPNDFLTEAGFGELLARLGDEEGELRGLAANAIGNAYCFHGQKRPYLVPQKPALVKTFSGMATKDEEPLARQYAVYALQWLAGYPRGVDCSERVLPALLAATRDEDTDVRWQAYLCLGTTRTKSPQTEAAFLAGLRDKESKVRAAAGTYVPSASEGGPEVVAALVALINDDDPWVRRGVAGALGAFADNSSAAVPALTERLRTESNRGVFTSLALALGAIGPAARSALPSIEKAFAASKQPSAGLAYALLQLGTTHQDAALNRLVDVALSDAGGQARPWLGRLGALVEPAIPRIVRALREGAPAERVEAAWTLRELGAFATPALPILETLAKEDADVDEKLVEAARGALEKLRAR